MNTALSKLINNEFISFFEDTNSYAQKIVDNSPLNSPVGSPRRITKKF